MLLNIASLYLMSGTTFFLVKTFYGNYFKKMKLKMENSWLANTIILSAE